MFSKGSTFFISLLGLLPASSTFLKIEVRTKFASPDDTLLAKLKNLEKIIRANRVGCAGTSSEL